MKKRILLLLLLLFSLFYIKDAFATEYAVKEYIPVTESSSVNTDLFYYRNMKFNFHVNSKGLTLITFDSIDNHSNKKRPISINLLLFDENKKNIGYLTYCSDKDIESDYSKFKIGPLQSHVFAINLTNIYFAENQSADNLKYVAVYDDNSYCQIGGYARYEGKTLEEIIDSGNSHNQTFSNRFHEIVESFIHSSYATILLYVVIAIVILSITGNVINKLYDRLYRVNTNFAYIPFLNYYICVKLAFGGLVGVGYFFFMILSLILWYFKIPLLFYLTNIMGVLSFLIVIFKLVTKKYNFLFFEPSLDEENPSLKDEKTKLLQKNEEDDKNLEDEKKSKKQEKEERKKKKIEMRIAKKIERERERERKKQEKLARKKVGTSAFLKDDVKNSDSSLKPISFDHVEESSSDPLSPLDELDLNYSDDNFKDGFDLSLEDDDDYKE